MATDLFNSGPGPRTGTRELVLQMALQALPIGVIAVAPNGDVCLCSSRAADLLGLDASFVEPPYPLSQLTGRLSAPLSDAGGGTAILQRPDNRTIRIAIHAADSGFRLLVITDQTEALEQGRALKEAKLQYRSLFENSVYGIYRDTVDGKPVRVNPALAAMNGYASEAEHIAAVQANATSWYVDPGRGEELLRLLARDGRVSDFVSQVKRHRTGEPLWVTENAWYVRDEDGKPLYIEGTIQDASERMTVAEALSRRARTDALTGCASRFHFLERLDAEVARPGNEFALLCLDLDLFKEINDVFGHAEGDAVLVAVAARLQQLIGPDGQVARLGGDEFAMIASSAEAVQHPDRFAQSVSHAMRTPIACGSRSHQIPVSAGIAVFPKHGDNAGELLRNADSALYAAKATGRNRIRVFDQELSLVLSHRREVETNLRGAAARGELELHYQAIVDARTTAIHGFEGLMRWQSPKLGRVSPVEFIPIAEQAGLMADIGAWAISRACEDAGVFHRDVRFGVNVSASQFRAPGFVAHVAHELERCGVPPDRIILEITETVLVSNESAARQLLADLRRLGVQIAIDDFGTGYSSLSYLQHLPINAVKIDRSFVAGVLDQKANQSVIRAVMAIGRDLGIRVVAEGIETEEQAQALRAEGCQYFQGYLYSRPRPLTDIVADLAVARLGGPAVTLPGRQRA